MPEQTMPPRPSLGATHAAPDEQSASEQPSRAPTHFPPTQPLYAQIAAQQMRRRTPWFVWLIGGCLGAIALLLLIVALIAGLVGGLYFKFGLTPTLMSQASSVVLLVAPPRAVMR